MTFWTPERNDVLRTLWLGGNSASSIGKMLGISRSAVIGKVHRLGIKRHEDTPKERPVRSEKRRRPVVVPISREPQPASAIKVLTEAVIACDDDHCRFPIGDPMNDPANFRFCMAPVEVGSYCSEHHALCKTKAFKPDLRPDYRSPVEFRRFA